MNYTTLNTEDTFEVRQYDPLVLAKVIVRGPFESAYREGGKLLLNYLSGNNYKKRRLVHHSLFMLTPRVDGWEVSCILPEGLTPSSSPRPVGEEIQFEEIQARKVVVHRFQGKSAYATMMKKIEELKKWAKNKDLNHGPAARILVYKSSFLPFLRRNEIQLDSI